MKVARTAVPLFGFWLAITGSLAPAELAVGAALSLALGVWATRLFWAQDAPVLTLRQTGRFVLYLGYLIKSIIIAAIGVAEVVLEPRMPIEPVLVTHHTSFTRLVSRVAFANSITLTPGTLTIDMEGQRSQVHCLDERFADRHLERRARATCRTGLRAEVMRHAGILLGAVAIFLLLNAFTCLYRACPGPPWSIASWRSTSWARRPSWSSCCLRSSSDGRSSSTSPSSMALLNFVVTIAASTVRGDRQARRYTGDGHPTRWGRASGQRTGADRRCNSSWLGRRVLLPRRDDSASCASRTSTLELTRRPSATRSAPAPCCSASPSITAASADSQDRRGGRIPVAGKPDRRARACTRGVPRRPAGRGASARRRHADMSRAFDVVLLLLLLTTALAAVSAQGPACGSDRLLGLQPGHVPRLASPRSSRRCHDRSRGRRRRHYGVVPPGDFEDDEDVRDEAAARHRRYWSSLAVPLLIAMASLPPHGSPISPTYTQRLGDTWNTVLEEAGAENIVTDIILNYRGFDTERGGHGHLHGNGGGVRRAAGRPRRGGHACEQYRAGEPVVALRGAPARPAHRSVRRLRR